MTSSATDKTFEIFGPIFEQNATINFEPIFEKNANSDRIFEKTINFENFVNGRWTRFKVLSLPLQMSSAKMMYDRENIKTCISDKLRKAITYM